MDFKEQTGENVETTGAGLRSTKKSFWQRRFTAKRISLIAVFVALSYCVSFLEFPLFPAAPFLKLDFGNVFILLIAFLLGPMEGVLVCLFKEALRALSSGSGGVGEIANFLVTSAYILLPAIVYQYKKGLKIVVASLVLACILGVGAALLANRFINFPLYMGAGAENAFVQLLGALVAFNLIKTVAVSVFTLLLYKRLSNFLKKLKF